MKIETFLGTPKPLNQWLKVCVSDRGQGHWLIFKDTEENEKITLATEMFPITGDTGELSDDEYEEFDESIIKSGFCNFLNLDQLEDVIDNLTIQKEHFDESELMRAVNHYFTLDAFITIKQS